MPVTTTYPGVYVQEVPSGVRTIAGVSTSVALVIGRAARGPIDEPVLCTSYLAYVRTFGEDLNAGSLTDYVRLFFLNGGTVCWAMRVAEGAAASAVQLQDAGSTDRLTLTAKHKGVAGEDIRALVTYDGPQPEVTFTLELWRWDRSSGSPLMQDTERWTGLSMNPNAPTYAPTYLTQNSRLVDGAVPTAPVAAKGYSQSGRVVEHSSETVFRTKWQALFGKASVTTNRFRLSVGGSAPVDIDLSTVDVGSVPTLGIRGPGGLGSVVEGVINAQLAGKALPPTKRVTVTFDNDGLSATGKSSLMRITATTAGDDVFIQPAATEDLAVPLMLGTNQGGIEVGSFAASRPAPSGITFDPSDANLCTLRSTQQSAVTKIVLQTFLKGGKLSTDDVAVDLQTTAATDLLWQSATGAVNGNSDGIREKLQRIAAAVNEAAKKSTPAEVFAWKATVSGHRLTLQLAPGDGRDNTIPDFTANPLTKTTDLSTSFQANVAVYSVGAMGNSIGTQKTKLAGHDGNPATAADYDDAYRVADKEIDLFNLLVLAPDAAIPVQDLYGNASVFCQKRRALLVMDAPAAWVSAEEAIAPTGVNDLRIGLVNDHAALYFPDLIVRGDDGLKKRVGPAGAMAGVMARTDATRGVWKAPAGMEASLRGIVGISQKFGDDDHGQLNPRAVNTIRSFPTGIVSFGARTMDGDDGFASEYKYVPIRRLALMIEESLYRGLRWVVFEPNDEPVWAQIRLNVGAFMHDLYRKGAFQGPKKEAYFVKCDGETTNQTDRNLGVVNIQVGFAPLKPAEFVVLYLRQMAGEIQV